MSTESDLRRLILDTARTVLLREGYQNLSMRKIARAMGYSATSIYLHFKNKDDLIHALIDEGMDRLYTQLKGVEAEESDPVARLEAVCRRYILFGIENPGYYRIMFQLHPEQMDRYPAESYRRARRNLDVLAQAVAEGTANGVFADKDPRIAASVIWTMMHGAVSLLLAERIDIRITREAYIEAVVHHTLDGFRALLISDDVTS